LHGEHLRAEANPQQRPPLRKRHRDPVDLAANILIRIVRAHRTAENDRPGMAVQRFRKRIAKARTPDIEPVSERPQHIADAARRRRLLVQHDQNRQQPLGNHRRPAGEAQHIFGVALGGLKRHRIFWFAAIKRQS
jgi:hypothetical protein